MNTALLDKEMIYSIIDIFKTDIGGLSISFVCSVLIVCFLILLLRIIRIIEDMIYVISGFISKCIVFLIRRE